MTIQTIAINALKISPLNVRKSKRQHIAALADDIASHGLIHNLVGYKNGKGYYVVAGGRRMEAMRLLQKDGRLGADHAVPVSIRPKKEAIELSLAENQSRDDMHPADAIEAYGKLASEGLSSDDIAARFGVTPVHVNRILVLVKLHPDIRAALAKDEIGLDASKAYTLTTDHEQQLRLFEQFGNNAHMVRRALTNDKVASDSSYFDIVPLEEYLEAGGTLTQDLFSDKQAGYADNMELLWSLLRQHMERVREEYLADGWLEVEICDQQPDNYYALNHLRPQGRRNLTEEEASQLAEFERQAEAIHQDDPEAEQWNNEALQAIDNAVRKIEQARLFFTDEQKADGKILIFIGHNGSLSVQPIALRRSSRKASETNAAPTRYSQRLGEAMRRIKLLAIREALASNPAIALDMLIASLVDNRLAYGINAPLAIRCNPKSVQVEDDLMANAVICDIEEQADSLCAVLDRSQLTGEIAAMESEAKMQLLATLCASLIDGDSSLPEDITQQLGIDMASKWQADAGFFARMTKPAMLDLLREICGEQAADNCRKLAKSDLCEEMARRLKTKGWMPPMLMIGNENK